MPKESVLNLKLNQATTEASHRLDASDPEQFGASITLEKSAKDGIWKTATDQELAEWALRETTLGRDLSSMDKDKYHQKIREAYQARALARRENLPNDVEISNITHQSFMEFYRQVSAKRDIEYCIAKLSDITEPAQVVSIVENILQYLESDSITKDSISSSYANELRNDVKEIIDLNLISIFKEGNDIIAQEMLQEKLQQTISKLKDLVKKYSISIIFSQPK